MVRGERDRELVATEWWDAWVNAGMVRPEDRSRILAGFSEKQKVNVCPGFRLRYLWPLPEAERLDSLRTSPGSQQTVFVAAVLEKMREAFRALGQDFDGFMK